MIALLIQVAIWGNALITGWVTSYQKRNIDADAGRVGTARVLSFVAQLVLYSVVVLLALDNIPGVEVTTLVASLGIGGIAVALAVQNILSDLFASLSIALDQPFIIGDFITLDDLAGTVEKIGLRSTRLRSLSGEQLSISNADLLSSRIHNYKRMQERRVVFSVGVLYETSAAQLRAIPAMVRAIIEAQGQTRFDRAHFKSFDDFALTFEVVYYVLTADYNRYMDTQQAINLAIFEQFGAAGIGFAFPTQTIHMARAGGQAEGRSNGADPRRETNRP
nr:mechanosensitive ion channel family protein [Oscillochloris sp. ZM17-4]